MKRRRGGNAPAFGAPTQDDASLLQPSHFPSATAVSTRILFQKAVPSLSSLAARCFVTHVQVLSENDRSWAYSKRYLKRLPDTLVPRLFSMLRSSCPTLLSHGLIVLVRYRTLFYRALSNLKHTEVLLAWAIPCALQRTTWRSKTNDYFYCKSCSTQRTSFDWFRQVSRYGFCLHITFSSPSPHSCAPVRSIVPSVWLSDMVTAVAPRSA